MKLTFYEMYPGATDLRPNKATRTWMDETHQSFAYRCLPLNIANAHGWSFHLKTGFFVKWDGGMSKDSLHFKSEEGLDVGKVAASAFGHGVLTFFIPGIFRTEKGWDIWTSGPANTVKDGITPLHGVIETDWAPYSFTMNWKITRPDTWIRFDEGEPFCSVFPVQHGYLQEIEPVIRPIDDNPQLKKEHEEWGKGRSKFIEDLGKAGSEASEQRWQKNYYQGKRPDGSDGPEDHLIKLRLKEFKAPQEGE